MNMRSGFSAARRGLPAGILPAWFCLVLLFPAYAAGGSFSGPTQDLRPAAVDAGGSSAASAGYNSLTVLGEAGTAAYASGNYTLQAGFGNLAAWPETILNLAASGGVSDGGLGLAWTAPSADGYTGAAEAYEIRYSTYPEGSPALGEAQFLLAHSATDFLSVPVPAAQGQPEQLNFSGLVGGGTYYFAIKARAAWNGWSYLSNGTTAQARLYAPSFGSFSGVTESAIGLSWTGSGNAPGSRYRVLVSTAPDPLAPAGALVSSSDTYNTSLSTSGLAANTTYYFRVAALAAAGGTVSYYFLPQGAATLAKIPAPAGLSGVGAAALTFSWGGNGNPPGTLYNVLVSTAPDPAAPGAALYSSSDTYSLSLSTTGLAADTTYYFRAAAVNRAGQYSAYSAAAATTTLALQPAGFYFTGVTEDAIQLNWDASGNPEDTLYRVAVSTAANPLSPSGAAVTYHDTYSLYLSSAGLEPFAYYYFRAAAVNHNGVLTAYAGAVNERTLSLGALGSPAAGSLTDIFVTSVTASWSLVAGATGYMLAASLSPDDPPTAIYTSSETAGLSASLFASPALTPDTSYYFFVRAGAANVAGSWYAFTPAATRVQFAPVSPALSGLANDSMIFSWSGNGNPGGTRYRVLVSTAPDPLAPAGAVVDSSDTYNLVLYASALAADTTYYFRAAGLNKDGLVTAYTGAIGSATLANMPQFSAFTDIAADGLRVNWTANGNAGDTVYRVLLSESPDPLSPEGHPVFSADVAGLYHDFSGLDPDTRYFTRVAARGKGGLETDYTEPADAVTLAAAPVFSGFSEVGSASARLDWTANGNAPGTLYRVAVSTAPDPLAPDGAAVTVSDTYNLFLTTAGLTPDTFYYFRAAAVNSVGAVSEYIAIQSTATALAGAPALDGFTNVGAETMRFNWTSGGNPDGTLYRVAVSTAPDPNAPAGAAATVTDTYELFLTSAGLSVNTTYYFRVAGVSVAGSLTAYTAAAGTSTLLAFDPVFAGFSEVAEGGMKFNWAHNGNPSGTLYRVIAAAGGDPRDAPDAGVYDTYDLFLATAGLAANTVYYFRVAGVNNNGVLTSYSALQSTSTLANPPLPAGFSGLTPENLTFGWTANGNPAGSGYRVAVSTASNPLVPGGAAVTYSDVYELGASSAGLSANTTYYFRVAAVNHDGVVSAYSAPQGTSTLLSGAPVFSGFSGMGSGAITFGWTTGSLPGGLRYRVLVSTAPDPASPDGAAVTSSDTYNLSLSTSGLSGNTRYYFRAAGLNNNGAAWDYSAAASTSTLAAAPVFSGFSDVTYGSIRLNWTAGDNVYPDTVYLVAASTAADPLNPSGADVVTGETEESSLLLSGLPTQTTYYCRVAARNNDGVLTAYTAAQSTVTLFANATKLYFQDSVTPVDAVNSRYLTRAAGAAVVTYTKNTFAGPTTPPLITTQFSEAAGGSAVTWYSPPLDDVTIAGNVTFNLWARESNFRANATITAELLRADGAGAIQSVIASVVLSRGEVSSAVLQLQNWGKIPASTALSNGDRLAVRWHIDDANGATLANGYNVTATLGGATPGVSGDAWMQLAEPLAPARPAIGALSGVTAAAASASWSLVEGATGYTLAASVSSLNPPADIYVSSTVHNTTGATLDTPALAPDTLYHLFVRTNGPGASSSWEAYPATYTLLAYPPAAAAIAGVEADSVTFSWSANGNAYPGTLFRVLVSTAPDPAAPAGAMVSVHDTYSLSLSSAGLAPDTTYYFRAAGLGKGGALTAYTAPVGIATLLPYVPEPAAFTDLAADSLRFNWTSGGNPAGTHYRVLASTAADPAAPAGAVVTSSDTYNTWLSSAGLAANTTYYFRVAGLNKGGVPTAYSAASGMATNAASPAFSGFSGVIASEAGFNWTSGGNPAGTLYRVYASLAPDPLDPQGLFTTYSDTYDSPAVFTGLDADTTYYFRAAAIGYNGSASAYTAAVATATPLAYPPLAAGFAAVEAGALTFDWTAGGNADPGTRYRVLASTAADPGAPAGAAVTSSDTYNTYLSSSGLAANTTYYFSVAGVGKSGVLTAYTAAAGTSTLLGYAPATGGFSGVSTGSVVFSWTSGGNPAGTRYRVLASTAADPLSPAGAAVTSSDTYSSSLNLAGLAANTTHYFRVAGLNNNGVPTAYSAAAGTSTLAAQPAGLYITGEATHVLQLNWYADGNRDGTLYRVLVSTAPDPQAPGGAAVTSHYVYDLFLSTAGLESNKTHYFRAAAVNNNGIYTAYAAQSGVTLAIGQLGTPAEGAVTGVFVSSIAASWSLVGGATGYTLAASLAPDNPPTAIYASSVTVGNGAAAAAVFSPALVADTVYYLFVRANGDEVSGPWFQYPAAATLLAKAPVYLSFADVGYNSARFNWSANGNADPGTRYRVLVSTAYNPLVPAGAVVSSSDTYNTYLSSAGLDANTAYYFRVAGVNKDGVLTAYTISRSTTTPARAPAAAGFTGVGPYAATFNWSAEGNPFPRTRYSVAVSTAPDPLVPGGAAATLSETYDLFFSSSGLNPDATYYFRVAAVGNNGITTAYTTAAGTATLLAYPPVAAGFTYIGPSSATFNWSANGNAAGTLYQVYSSTAQDPLNPGGAVAVSSDTYNLYLSSAGLYANTTYYFTVAGRNRNGVSTAYTAAAGTATLANLPLTAVSTFSAVTNAGFTAAWEQNGNPVGTLYEVQVSSAQDFNPGVLYQVSAATAPEYGASYAFTDLVFSTTYYFRARAVNRNGLYTAYAGLGAVKTAGLQAPVAAPITQVSADSITAGWSLVAQATGYTLAASVNPGSEPSPVYASSSTAGLSALLSPLALNSTYYLFVRADGAGEASGWAVYPATATLANPPVSAASTFSAVGFDGFAVNWGANSNPLGSVSYQVEVSTAYDFNAGVTDRVSFSTAPAEGPAATFSGLNTDAYYYFRVRTAYHNGNFSDWVSLGVKKTLALPIVHAAGDGVILYGKAGTAMPQFRHYSAASNSFGATGDLEMGGNGSLFVIRTNPLTTKQEAVAGYVKDGTLHVLCTDGTNWTEEWTQAVGGNETTRRFDIAYETNSGDVMVLYSRNTAASGELGYRTKPGGAACGGSNWTAETPLTAARTTGIVQWVKLASDRRATYDTLAALWADANSDLSAAVWTGSAWENEPAAALETSLETVAAAQDVEDFDLEFESLSGDLMAVWANAAGADGTNGVRYAVATWTGGSPLHTWGAVTTPPTFLDDATNLDLAANPASDAMIFASIGNAGSDLQIGYWSGAAWTNTANVDTTAQVPLAGTRLVSAVWLSSGAATRWAVAYNDAAATNIGWYYGTTGAPSAGADASPAPLFANPQKHYQLHQDPVNRDRAILAVSDNNSDLIVKRLVMTSVPAFTWSDAAGGAALETSLSSVTVGGHSFFFWPAPPETTYVQSAYKFFANADSTDVGAALAAQDTPGVILSSGAAFRLRPLLHIDQVDLAAGAESFKLQFAGRGDGTCAAPSGGNPAVYTDVGAATVIAFNNNTPADGAALTANAADPQHGAHVTVAQAYAESSPAATLALTARNRDAMWDFALKDNGMAAGTSYCFKLVRADGTDLNAYDSYPEAMLQPAVYLNEIYASGAVGEDWVEFYNNSASTVSLIGWKLDYVENTLDLGGTPITVWTAQASDVVNAYSTFTLTGLATDLVGGQSYHLKLMNNTGAIVDQAQWPVLGAGQSLARVTDGDPSFFWIDPSPTPGYGNSVSTDALKINEVAYGAPDRQFVELYNASPVSTRTLSGYALRNSVSSANGLAFKFTRKIYPLDYAVIDFSSLSDDGYTFAGVFGPGGLAAAGDFLALENSTGSVVDWAVWQSGTAYTLYNYRAEQVSAGNFAPAGASSSIARGPSEGADTGSDAADFSASAYATPVSRNNNAGAAAANTLVYPVNTSAPQFLAKIFPVTLALGASSGGAGNNILFQRTGGASDPESPHLYRLQDMGIDPASMAQQSAQQTGLAFYDQDGAPLVSSAVYRVTFNSAAGAASAPRIELGTVTYYAGVHGLSVSSSAPAFMNDASRAGVLKLQVANNNPAGFNPVQLATVAFSLYDSGLVPLTQQQARDLFEAVMLVADSASGLPGIYEPGIDVSTLAYVPMNSILVDGNGLSTMTVGAAWLASASVPAASTGTFFIVLESTADASARTPSVFRAGFSPVRATVLDGPGALAQEFSPAAAANTDAVTLISPALPPAGTSWPYSLPAAAASESPVAYYTNDGGTAVSSTVYVASVDGRLRALNKDGTLKWSYSTSPLSPIRTSPNAVVEGSDVVIYFANDNGDVYKVRDDGTAAGLVWKQGFGSPVRSNVMCADMGCTGPNIYFGVNDNTVRCLAKSGGQPCSGWTFAAAITAPVSGTLSIDDRDTIKTGWVGLEDGKVVALQTADGASPTSLMTGGPIKSSPYLDARYADANNVVYFTSTDGKLYARVSSNLSTLPTGWLADYQTPGAAPIYTSPSVSFLGTKYVFFGDDGGRLHKVDVTGASAPGWPVQAGGMIRSSPVWVPGATVGIAQNYVYFGCDDGYIYAIDADTGARRPGWPVATGGPVRADLVVDPDDRTIKVGSTDGKTYTLYIGP
ncbi:MAG: fibronectin type III domain-containing protein [Elusimicrobiales bacterium]|nr:fibronectin type III domain-containing protein [Elusimicrobiales bacterium]